MRHDEPALRAFTRALWGDEDLLVVDNYAKGPLGYSTGHRRYHVNLPSYHSWGLGAMRKGIQIGWEGHHLYNLTVLRKRKAFATRQNRSTAKI